MKRTFLIFFIWLTISGMMRCAAQQNLVPIQFNRVSYLKEGKPFYLLSGEFHYFRVPREDWKKRMELLKQAGGNCLATYVPWLIHEPREGTFDFGGEGFRDLEGFLKLAKEENLYVIVRPGPYQYTELNYDGLPGWLCENYPQIRARDFAGKDYRIASISYQHPLFLEKVKKWYDKVCPILAKYTVNKGGPVVFMQLDNELTGVHIWNNQLDYNPETMGFGKQEGKFAGFLQQKYGKIDALNAHYGTKYAGFADVFPLNPILCEKIEELRQQKDYHDFYFTMAAEYLDTLAAMARGNGIDVPLVHNAANPEMIPYFKETTKKIEPPFLLGMDSYYSLDQTWPQNNPTPQYIARTFFGLEMLRLMGYPPTIFEIASGSISDWPPTTATDAKACYMASLAFGMKGHNYYIFTGGVNPMGYGSTADIYDYNAPVSVKNELRPLYFAQKEVAKFISDENWITEATKVHDCRIALDFEYARSDRYWKGKGTMLFTGPDAWKMMVRGVLSTAMCAGISPEFCDLSNPEFLKDATPIIVVTSVTMSAEKQQNIVNFLGKGGRVLLLPVVPTLDEDFNPCTILSDFMGKPQVAASKGFFARASFGDIRNVMKDELFALDKCPDHAELLGKDEITGNTIAFKIKTAGNGILVWTGISWTARQNEQGRMLSYLLSEIGFKQKVSSNNPNVWITLRSDGKHELLFLMNLFTSKQTVDVSYTDRSGKKIMFGKVQVEAMTVKTLKDEK